MRRLIAFSLNAPTPAFNAAVAALRSAGNTVDFFAKRSFAESVHGYHGVLLSLGDLASPQAQPVKLAALKAACELPVCLFLDRDVPEITTESFWASAVVGETTNDRVHRSEMLVALKGEWRAKIDDRIERWRPWALSGITPAFESLRLPKSWEPTPFHFTPSIPTRKTVPRIDTFDDRIDVLDIARTAVVARHRGEPREPRWSALPIDCVRLKAIYLDGQPYHDCENAATFAEDPTQAMINRRLDQQADAYFGVKKRTQAESAKRLDAIVSDELRTRA